MLDLVLYPRKKESNCYVYLHPSVYSSPFAQNPTFELSPFFAPKLGLEGR